VVVVGALEAGAPPSGTPEAADPLVGGAPSVPSAEAVLEVAV
jgi:hypothetical protein